MNKKRESKQHSSWKRHIDNFSMHQMSENHIWKIKSCFLCSVTWFLFYELWLFAKLWKIIHQTCFLSTVLARGSLAIYLNSVRAMRDWILCSSYCFFLDSWLANFLQWDFFNKENTTHMGKEVFSVLIPARFYMSLVLSGGCLDKWAIHP